MNGTNPSTREMPDKTNRIDIHAYLAELEDIPGTRVFTAQRARKGYWLNQFAMSLMKEENRRRFKADNTGYLEEWDLSPAPNVRYLIVITTR